MKKVAVLGITGSIGKTALRGINLYKDSLELCACTYHKTAPTGLKCPTLKLDGNYGELEDFLKKSKADVVLNAISGSAGLQASISCVNAGITLALANKETIVLGGNLFLDYAKQKKVRIIPVDSEHSAIEELLITNKVENTDKLIITASGGPFLNTPGNLLEKITPMQAVKHPTWNMGPKISVDSATLANKGLEIIEAHYLFGFEPQNIEVVIHPQSIVHSMIRTKSGQIYAQMSPPDMIFPVTRALLNRDFPKNAGEALDFSNLQLTFSTEPISRFPFIADAYRCIEQEGWLPVVYNTSNEVAVEQFMNSKIGFTRIHDVVSKALEMNYGPEPDTLGDIPSAVEYVRNKVKKECL